MINFWSLLGFAILSWGAWDIYAGYTVLLNVVYRESDPSLYWAGILIWTIIALSCFFSWGDRRHR